MRLTRHLPNLLTGLNLACGTGALMCALDGRTTLIPLALGLVVLALLFDLADGRVARHLQVASPLGMELDSLADLVSFGAAPALLLWRHRLADAGAPGVLAVLAFVMAGAFRLARFNVLAQAIAAGTAPKSAGTFFTGMPIPAGAALVLTAGLGHCLPGFGAAVAVGAVQLSLFVAAALMVSTLPYPSPKVLPLGNRRFVALLAVSLAGAVMLLRGQVALLSAVYAVTGVLGSLVRRRRARVLA